MTMPEQSISERLEGAIAWLNKEGFGDIRVSHMREHDLLIHEFDFATADHVEDDVRLGYNRLILKHPHGCGCQENP